MDSYHLTFCDGCSFLSGWSQARMFGALTNGTIPLLAINLIEWMSILTMRLSCICSRNRVTFTQSVFSDGSQSKMSDFYASPIPANMIDNHLWGYIAKVVPIDNPMCSSIFTAKKETSVTIFIKATRKIQAITDFLGFANKSGIFSLAHGHGRVPLVRVSMDYKGI